MTKERKTAKQVKPSHSRLDISPISLFSGCMALPRDYPGNAR